MLLLKENSRKITSEAAYYTLLNLQFINHYLMKKYDKILEAEEEVVRAFADRFGEQSQEICAIQKYIAFAYIKSKTDFEKGLEYL